MRNANMCNRNASWRLACPSGACAHNRNRGRGKPARRVLWLVPAGWQVSLGQQRCPTSISCLASPSASPARSAAAAAGSPPCTRPSPNAGQLKCGASACGCRHCSGRQAGTPLAAPGCGVHPARPGGTGQRGPDLTQDAPWNQLRHAVAQARQPRLALPAHKCSQPATCAPPPPPLPHTHTFSHTLFSHTQPTFSLAAVQEPEACGPQDGLLV